VRRRRRACALEVDVADDAEGSGGGKDADEVQLDEGGSDGGDGVVDFFLHSRGEAAGAEVVFGCSRRCGSAAGKSRGTHQGGASEDVERIRRREGVRGSLIPSITSGDGGGSFGFRRGISLWLVDDSEKEKREMEEDVWGNRGSRKPEGVRLWMAR
jgi:hypothetical protein